MEKVEIVERFFNLSVCEKKTKIVFLKTHKCASSSLQNIFFRFGEKHNLTHVLGNSGNYLGGKFQRSILADTPWGKAGMNYSLLCLHTIFNKHEIEAVMGSRTSYVTMLRDPIDVFESQYSFYGLGVFYGMSLEDFALAPKTGKLLHRASIQGRNQMLFDLGLDPKDMDNESMVESKIKEINERFDLVMIKEKFNESLVLLKEELCWNLADVTNFKLNGRREEVQTRLSNETRSKLKEFLKADYMLYDHFKEKLEKKIEDYGIEKMNKEVEKLERINEGMRKKCSITSEDNRKLRGNQKWWGANLVGYRAGNSSNEDCLLMTMSELAYIERIRRKQREAAKIIISSQNQL